MHFRNFYLKQLMHDVRHLIIFFFKMLLMIIGDNTVQCSDIPSHDSKFLRNVSQF